MDPRLAMTSFLLVLRELTLSFFFTIVFPGDGGKRNRQRKLSPPTFALPDAPRFLGDRSTVYSKSSTISKQDGSCGVREWTYTGCISLERNQ